MFVSKTLEEYECTQTVSKHISETAPVSELCLKILLTYTVMKSFLEYFIVTELLKKLLDCLIITVLIKERHCSILRELNPVPTLISCLC
jgi:hypothetical protein